MDNNEALIPSLPREKGKWARPEEFNEWKQIVVEGFEVLTVEEVQERDKRTPYFLPKDGLVRRLYFTEMEFGGERTLEVNSRKFQTDLAKYGIKKGVAGYMRRDKKPGKKSFDWEWKPV